MTIGQPLFLTVPPQIYSHEKVIAKAAGAFGRPYVLVYVPECEEIAGSGTRHVQECYRVVYRFDGNRHSKAYKTLAQAKEEFDRLTKPIIEQGSVS